MRTRLEMSLKQFRRLHPDLEIEPVKAGDFRSAFFAINKASGLHVAYRAGTYPPQVVYELSVACYRLAALDVMAAQGWKDANTGQTGVPLDAHHLVKRSKGRDDSAANLAGVSRATHDAQHHRKQEA